MQALSILVIFLIVILVIQRILNCQGERGSDFEGFAFVGLFVFIVGFSMGWLLGWWVSILLCCSAILLAIIIAASNAKHEKEQYELACKNIRQGFYGISDEEVHILLMVKRKYRLDLSNIYRKDGEYFCVVNEQVKRITSRGRLVTPVKTTPVKLEDSKD